MKIKKAEIKMSSKIMPKARPNWRQITVVMSVILALVLAIINISLYSSISSTKNKIEIAKTDYNKILEIAGKIKALKEKIPPGADIDIPNNPEGLLEFFANQARESGLKEMVKGIGSVRGGSTRIKGWKEYSYSISIVSTPTEKIKINNLVKFLFNIEQKKTFLKTKDIVINQFSPEGDIQRADIIISYFNRE